MGYSRVDIQRRACLGQDICKIAGFTPGDGSNYYYINVVGGKEFDLVQSDYASQQKISAFGKTKIDLKGRVRIAKFVCPKIEVGSLLEISAKDGIIHVELCPDS